MNDYTKWVFEIKFQSKCRLRHNRAALIIRRRIVAPHPENNENSCTQREIGRKLKKFPEIPIQILIVLITIFSFTDVTVFSLLSTRKGICDYIAARMSIFNPLPPPNKLVVRPRKRTLL